MKKLIATILILACGMLLWNCASQTTPTGGPKDIQPPKLEKSIPANNQTDFKGKSVELVFNEMVKLDNPKEEIIITPPPNGEVLFRTKQNKVFIEPKIGWPDSTTFSISFREGIQDMNEGNPAKNLHLAFSTGKTIDSLRISGKITQALVEKIPDDITVALYQQDTFNIFNHTPVYFTKTTENGSFKLENLKSGTYFIYAFDDKNKNLKVESKTEKFAFQPNQIKLQKNIDTLRMAVYLIDSRPLLVNSIRNTGTVTKVKFNKDLVTYHLKKDSNVHLFHCYSANQSEIDIYNNLNLNDSTAIQLTGTDSLEQYIDTTFYIKRIETKQSKDKFSTKINSASIDAETYKVEASISFSKPIGFLNLDSLYLTPDPVPTTKKIEEDTKGNTLPKIKPENKRRNPAQQDIQRTDTLLIKKSKQDTTTTKSLPLRKFKILRNEIHYDTIKKTLLFSTTIDKSLLTPKDKQISLVLEPLFIISNENDSSKRDIKQFFIPDPETTGVLLIEVTTKSPNYAIQLLSSDGKLIQEVRNAKTHSFKYLQPQDYKLRIYRDLNNNSVWDAQNIIQNRMAEPTFFYKTTEGKYTVPIRAAWEYGPVLIKF